MELAGGASVRGLYGISIVGGEVAVGLVRELSSPMLALSHRWSFFLGQTGAGLKVWQLPYRASLSIDLGPARLLLGPQLGLVGFLTMLDVSIGPSGAVAVDVVRGEGRRAIYLGLDASASILLLHTTSAPSESTRVLYAGTASVGVRF
jgi:hypothetical protein